jgi:hypothetical protein
MTRKAQAEHITAVPALADAGRYCFFNSRAAGYEVTISSSAGSGTTVTGGFCMARNSSVARAARQDIMSSSTAVTVETVRRCPFLFRLFDEYCPGHAFEEFRRVVLVERTPDPPLIGDPVQGFAYSQGFG